MRAPGRPGTSSGGVNPRKASTAGALRGFGGSTDSPRERGPEDGWVPSSPAPPGAWRRGGAGNAKRAGAPRGVPIAVEGKALKGEAQGRSGTIRAGRVDGGRREGGSQTPDATRAAGGTAAAKGSVAPRVCRRARKAQESKRRLTSRLRVGGTARGPGDRSLEGSGSPRRAAHRLRPTGRRTRRNPGGRRNAVRGGRNP